MIKVKILNELCYDYIILQQEKLKNPLYNSIISIELTNDINSTLKIKRYKLNINSIYLSNDIKINFEVYKKNKKIKKLNNYKTINNNYGKVAMWLRNYNIIRIMFQSGAIVPFMCDC